MDGLGDLLWVAVSVGKKKLFAHFREGQPLDIHGKEASPLSPDIHSKQTSLSVNDTEPCRIEKGVWLQTVKDGAPTLCREGSMAIAACGLVSASGRTPNDGSLCGHSGARAR